MNALGKSSPLTIGLALALFAGIVALILMMLNLSDRFVTKEYLDLRLDKMRAEIGEDLAEFKLELMTTLNAKLGEGDDR